MNDETLTKYIDILETQKKKLLEAQAGKGYIENIQHSAVCELIALVLTRIDEVSGEIIKIQQTLKGANLL